MNDYTSQETGYETEPDQEIDGSLESEYDNEDAELSLQEYFKENAYTS